MFGITRKKDNRTNLEKEIDSVLAIMSSYQPGSDEYTTMTKNLELLYKAKSHQSDRRVSPDTVVTVVGSLLGMVMIMTYERTEVITTKALGFILKGRV
jgi:hypothetical protein